MCLCVCPKFVSQGKVWPWLTSQTITHNFDYTNYLILNGVTITPRLHCGIFKGYSNYSLYWKSSRNVLNAYKGMSIIFCSYLGDVSTILLFGKWTECLRGNVYSIVFHFLLAFLYFLGGTLIPSFRRREINKMEIIHLEYSFHSFVWELEWNKLLGHPLDWNFNQMFTETSKILLIHYAC